MRTGSEWVTVSAPGITLKLIELDMFLKLESKREFMSPPPPAEELWIAAGFGRRKNAFSLKMWLLVRWPFTRGRLHTREYMDSTNCSAKQEDSEVVGGFGLCVWCVHTHTCVFIRIPLSKEI